jgi:hypothetical protein
VEEVMESEEKDFLQLVAAGVEAEEVGFLQL